MVDGFDTTILLLPLIAVLLGCLAIAWMLLQERAANPPRILLSVSRDGRIIGRLETADEYGRLEAGRRIRGGKAALDRVSDGSAGNRMAATHPARFRRSPGRGSTPLAAESPGKKLGVLSHVWRRQAAVRLRHSAHLGRTPGAAAETAQHGPGGALTVRDPGSSLLPGDAARSRSGIPGARALGDLARLVRSALTRPARLEPSARIGSPIAIDAGCRS